MTNGRRSSGAYAAEKNEAPREIPRLALRRMERRWFLIPNLNKFTAKNDIARMIVSANEFGSRRTRKNPVARADG